MADVFISYSKQAPHHTRELAQQLEARGFTIWWDTELLPGDKFHDRIRDEITAAKVVIVIWSPASVDSKWVQAEATMASAQNKLLTVCTPDLDGSRVPLPFNMLHIEKVGAHDKLLAAFAARGLYPRDEAKARLAQRAEECVRLAAKCRNGDGQPVDVDQAIKLLQEAIQLGHPSAKHELGNIYAWGEPSKHRHAEALRLVYEAKAAGNLAASATLGQMYLRGIGVAKDLEEGLRLLQEAADANVPLSHLVLGVHYQYGLEGVPRNVELAKRHYLRGTEAGDAHCCHRLGILHMEQGEPQRGVYYFKKASDLGLGLARLSLAVAMLDGRGIEQNVAEAVALLEREARSDDRVARPQALARLGGLHITGFGVEENLPKAISLLNQAIDLGDTEAMCTLADLYEMHPKVPRDETKVLALLERATAKGSLEGKARLGRAHIFRKNTVKGLQLLREAEKEGSGLAAFVLGMCYQHAAGVPRNHTEARRWFKVAEARGQNVIEALKELD